MPFEHEQCPLNIKTLTAETFSAENLLRLSMKDENRNRIVTLLGETSGKDTTEKLAHAKSFEEWPTISPEDAADYAN